MMEESEVEINSSTSASGRVSRPKENEAVRDEYCARSPVLCNYMQRTSRPCFD